MEPFLNTLSMLLDWLEDNWIRVIIAAIILGIVKELLLG